jgi:hypothetical protein
MTWATHARSGRGISCAVKEGDFTYDSGSASSNKSGSCHFAQARRCAQESAAGDLSLALRQPFTRFFLITRHRGTNDRCLPPLEDWRGTKPIDAANCLPFLYCFASPTVANIAVADSGPTPPTDRKWSASALLSRLGRGPGAILSAHKYDLS